ncbi:MAG: NAD-dependent deacylase [Phycisphaerales bacterium]|nr:MAG: NAD-dependent deacylase [Phycisphaerales bacterium]
MTDFPPAMLDAVRSARHVVALTGAGVSAESGVPTFRDAQTGLWAKYDPMELATPEAFARDPALVSRWYDERRQMRLTTQPNPGHHALVRWEALQRAGGESFTLLTQNVDRLHHAAGSVNVVELHGSLMVWRCTACGEEREELGPAFQQHPPRCGTCGGTRRPGVVWFGEALPGQALEAAFDALRRCDLFLTIGTSAVVHPAASFLHDAAEHGAATIEINRDHTPASDVVGWTLRAKSGEALPAMLDAAFG